MRAMLSPPIIVNALELRLLAARVLARAPAEDTAIQCKPQLQSGYVRAPCCVATRDRWQRQYWSKRGPPGLEAAVSAEAASAPDPIFAAIEKHRKILPGQ
jgi:hypothetical protein